MERKLLARFGRKDSGGLNSTGYDMHIPSKVEVHFSNGWVYGRLPMFQHDNAPRHRSSQTNVNLVREEIEIMQWPPYIKTIRSESVITLIIN